MAYRDWETHLGERHLAETLSGAPAPRPALRQKRPGSPVTHHRTAGRPSRRVSRSHASVGLRWVQYRLNAVHLTAVLVRWGVPRPWALAVARRWERVSRAWLHLAES